MSEKIDPEEIVRLRTIKEDLHFMKNYMVDMDSIMTEDDNLYLN